MAKTIVWSPLAQSKRKEILAFWIKNNKSNRYSATLNKLFKEAARLLSIYPEIGKRTYIKNVRVKIVRDYQIYYQIEDDRILLLTIWDSRQNPEELKLK